MRVHCWLLMIVPLLAGCSIIPDVVHEPQFHNPFPQLSRVAVLPFFNQSDDPTVDQDRIAIAYYNELQHVPGFEVMPVGVAKRKLEESGLEPKTGAEWQRLAQYMGVAAIVVGSLTEYSPYYPPRLGLAVNWYAANPGFHPIPPGYGLPWGTSEEEFIPDSLVFEAEFALAREQLKTQTPEPDAVQGDAGIGGRANHDASAAPSAGSAGPLPAAESERSVARAAVSDLPADWPDPRGLIPPPPAPNRPPYLPQNEPVLEYTRLFQGNDAELTQRLAKYVTLRDEARFGGWQAYLQRSDDFVRFCCYLHITEMLAARGGAGKTRVVWRWPIGRYEP